MTSRRSSPFRVSSSSPASHAGTSRRTLGRDGNERVRAGMRPSLGAPAAPPLPLAACPFSKVLLAQPRGFCAGVEMAIKALAWMVRIFEPPVYCYHEIVHNRLVVERFEALGVVFVDDIDDGPGRRPAHALRPRLGARGGRRGPGARTASSSTRCARSSRRSTTRPRSAPARATRSSTSATPATTRRSAPWRRARVDPPRRARGGRRRRSSTGSPIPTKVALLAQTTLALHDWQGITDRARGRVPRALDRDPQRPLLRDHQPPGGALGDRGRRPTRSS